jgi:protease-4
MRRNPWFVILFIVVGFILLSALIIGVSTVAIIGDATPRLKNSNSLFVVKLDGVILDSQKFLKKIRKYKDEKSIRGILIRLDSPGGAVGASEEIYLELKKLKIETKKPIVVYSPNLNASGGYYVSMAADKIVVTKGALIGSIGVIMEFANLEKLYDWAKISRFTITSGKFKDSGNEFRTMRDDEKEYFQSIVLDAFKQFKGTVAENRKLKPGILDTYADGRVFSGQQAVDLGFADQVGTEEDAIKTLAELAGVKDHYEIFEMPKNEPNIIERLINHDDEDYDSLFKGGGIQAALSSQIEKVFRTQLLNRPLFLMPGYWPSEK